jgi:xanthine/uracil permease
MKILLDDVGGLKRRNRFIVAATFACGIGVTLWPAWAQNNLWPIDGHMKDGSAMGEAKLGVRNAILLILQTGFCFAFFVSFILNLVLPMDRDEPDETVHLHHYADEDSSMPDKEAVAEAVAA